MWPVVVVILQPEIEVGLQLLQRCVEGLAESGRVELILQGLMEARPLTRVRNRTDQRGLTEKLRCLLTENYSQAFSACMPPPVVLGNFIYERPQDCQIFRSDISRLSKKAWRVIRWTSRMHMDFEPATAGPRRRQGAPRHCRSDQSCSRPA